MKNIRYKHFNHAFKAGTKPQTEQYHIRPAYQLRPSPVLSPQELRGVIMEMLG